MAAPMPLVPPVISADLPEISNMMTREVIRSESGRRSQLSYFWQIQFNRNSKVKSKENPLIAERDFFQQQRAAARSKSQ
jgi:hypothetical protein